MHQLQQQFAIAAWRRLPKCDRNIAKYKKIANYTMKVQDLSLYIIAHGNMTLKEYITRILLCKCGGQNPCLPWQSGSLPLYWHNQLSLVFNKYSEILL